MLAHAVWHVCEQDPKVQARSMLALVWLKSIYDITKHLGDTECTSPPWRCKLSVERWAVVHQGSSQARVGWGVARAPEGFGKPWRPLTAVSSLISVLLGSSVAEKTETKSLICLGAPEELVAASCASRREGTL